MDKEQLAVVESLLAVEEFRAECEVAIEAKKSELLLKLSNAYERRGHERLNDLRVLCNACHSKLHDKEPA